MSKVKIEEKLDRKTLSTRAYLILADLVEEENAIIRARKILSVMRILKEME